MSEQMWLNNYPVEWNLEYPETSLYRYLKINTADYDNYTAMVYSGRNITFHKMHENIDKFAAALKDLGVKQGDRVAIIMPNCPEYVYAYRSDRISAQAG